MDSKAAFAVAIASTVVVFAGAICLCLWLWLRTRTIRTPTQSPVESFVDAALPLTSDAQTWANQMQCVHNETGYAFSTELLVRDPSNVMGDVCVLNNSALGLLSDPKNSCALAPDSGGWANLLTVNGCYADPACSNALLVPDSSSGTSGMVFQGVTPWTDQSCMLSFSPYAVRSELAAFESSLKNNVGQFLSGSVIDHLNQVISSVETQLVSLSQESSSLQSTVAADSSMINKLQGELDAANSSLAAGGNLSAQLKAEKDKEAIALSNAVGFSNAYYGITQPQTCTVVLSAAYCDAMGCWADSNVYIKFKDNTIATLPFPPYYDPSSADLSNAVTSWATATNPDKQSYYSSLFADANNYELRGPLVYTSAGPGVDHIKGRSKLNRVSFGNFVEDGYGGSTNGGVNGNGRLGEIAELIPNNGAFCSFTALDDNGQHWGTFNAVNGNGTGVTYGHERNGKMAYSPFGLDQADPTVWTSTTSTSPRATLERPARSSILGKIGAAFNWTLGGTRVRTRACRRTVTSPCR